jgi:hypothetical protein
MVCYRSIFFKMNLVNYVIFLLFQESSSLVMQELSATLDLSVSDSVLGNCGAMVLDGRISKAECGEQNGNFLENASCFVPCLESLEFECSCTYVVEGMRILNKEGCYWQQRDETQQCQITQTSNFLQTSLEVFFQEVLTEEECEEEIRNALTAEYVQEHS